MPRSRTIVWAAAALVALLGVRPAVAERTVAITIDDLPRGGDGGARDLDSVLEMTERLLRPFRGGEIPVAGFVNAGRLPEWSSDDLSRILDLWLDAGAELGNHSYSHPNINEVPLEAYTADITRGEPALRSALEARGRKLRYFRHPFLRTGSTAEVKRAMQAFLDAAGYEVAPVTIDNAEYLYAALYTTPSHRARARREYVAYMESVVAFFVRRARDVVGRDIPQILLIHANALNADLMPELLKMFRDRGYAFVSLEAALADPVYREPDPYVGGRGVSWIHRYGIGRGLDIEWEPDPPDWAIEAFRTR